VRAVQSLVRILLLGPMLFIAPLRLAAAGAGRIALRFSLPAARKEVRFREALKLIKFSLI